MRADLIDPAVHRLDVLAHLSACTPCARLLCHARTEGDLGALAAWRTQLASHGEADREREEFERAVARRVATSASRGASLIELLVSVAIVVVLAGTALYHGLETAAHVRVVVGK